MSLNLSAIYRAYADTHAGDIDFVLIAEDAADGRGFETDPRSPCGAIDDDDRKIVANIGADDVAGDVRWQDCLNLSRQRVRGGSALCKGSQ